MVDFRDIKYCCIGIEINKFELKKRPVLASQNVTGADGYLLVDENVSQSLQDEVKE